MIQELLHLKKLAEAASGLPKGTKSTPETRFYVRARQLVPSMVDELVKARERAEDAKHAGFEKDLEK